MTSALRQQIYQVLSSYGIQEIVESSWVDSKLQAVRSGTTAQSFVQEEVLSIDIRDLIAQDALKTMPLLLAHRNDSSNNSPHIIMVQIEDYVNSCQSDMRNISANPRCLKLVLCDGYGYHYDALNSNNSPITTSKGADTGSLLCAIEMQACPQLTANMARGCKCLIFLDRVRIRRNTLMLTTSSIRVLGGAVKIEPVLIPLAPGPAPVDHTSHGQATATNSQENSHGRRRGEGRRTAGLGGISIIAGIGLDGEEELGDAVGQGFPLNPVSDIQVLGEPAETIERLISAIPARRPNQPVTAALSTTRQHDMVTNDLGNSDISHGNKINPINDSIHDRYFIYFDELRKDRASLDALLTSKPFAPTKPWSSTGSYFVRAYAYSCFRPKPSRMNPSVLDISLKLDDGTGHCMMRVPLHAAYRESLLAGTILSCDSELKDKQSLFDNTSTANEHPDLVGLLKRLRLAAFAQINLASDSTMGSSASVSSMRSETRSPSLVNMDVSPIPLDIMKQYYQHVRAKLVMDSNQA